VHIFQERINVVGTVKLLTTSSFGEFLVANNITILKLPKTERSRSCKKVGSPIEYNLGWR